ncbi:MAG TPA: hypothetical protein VIL37_16655 [Natronosporangium sp.]
MIDALPTSTASYLLNGRGLPRLPRLELVEAFVTACLRAREEPEPVIRSEVEQWRAAWHRLAGGQTLTGPRSATAPAASPADSPATVGKRDGGSGKPAHRASWRPGWPVTVAAAVAAAGLALAGTLIVTNGEDGPADPAAIVPPISPATEILRGSVPALTDQEGIDLDTGEVGPQETPGIDISPWALGNHVTANDNALIELLAEPGEVSYERCARVPAADLTDQVRGLYDVDAGAALCVWTREGRVAMLVLTQKPSQQLGVLSFDFVVWEP